MKKAAIIALSIVICLAALVWITIETNPEIATRLGFASGPGKPVEVAPDTPNAMVPSIVYEGNLYRTTGKQIPATVDESAIVGHISSVVPLSQLPSNEGEANFGEVGDPYAVTSDGLLVLMDNEWTVFEFFEKIEIQNEMSTVPSKVLYYRNDDGTWEYEGHIYQYRLEIGGRMPNAAVDTTFVYLSNLETITFEQAWKAAGFSSNTADYFTVEDAVLVEVQTH